MQNRFKSPILWASIVGQLISLLVLLNVIELPFGEVINQAVAYVLQILVLFGVLNNPTDKENF